MLRARNVERTWTSEEFEKLIYTVEGQFKVSLGHEIGKKAIVDDIELDVPIGHKPIYIEKPELNHWDQMLGLVNSNSDPNYMEKICQYVKCEATNEICYNTVKPFGHCCDICGAVVNFSLVEGNRDIIWGHIYERFMEKKLYDYIDLFMERKDPDAAPVEFQVSMFVKQQDKGNDIARFHEEKFFEAVQIVENVLDSHIGGVASTMISYTSEVSRTDRSVKKMSFYMGMILSCVLIGGVVYFVLKKDTTLMDQPILPEYISQWLTTRFEANRRDTNYESRVVWRRGDTEDIILIDNPTYVRNDEETVEEEEISKSEEENQLPKLSTAEQGPSILISSPKTGKSPNSGEIEMTLIDL